MQEYLKKAMALQADTLSAAAAAHAQPAFRGESAGKSFNTTGGSYINWDADSRDCRGGGSLRSEPPAKPAGGVQAL